MAIGISLWRDGKKGKTYNFIDRHISQFIRISGTPALIHLFLGVHDQTDEAAVIAAGGTPSTKQPLPTDIQDVLLQENRDRKYSPDVYEVFITKQLSENDWDMKQFGLFLTGDTTYLEMHINDSVAILGRKPMPGDVLEFPHERDDMLLDGGEAINKYYVIDEVTRASGGYSATWLPHLWRIKIKPMTGAQEYQDILDGHALDPFGLPTGSSLMDILTTTGKELGMNETIVANARANVSKREFETRHLYLVEPGPNGENPWVFAGDGIPPNGAALLGRGKIFPKTGMHEGDYFLNTGYTPECLFQRVGAKWVQREFNYRGDDWSAMPRIMTEFVNNNAVETHDDGTTAPQKVNLSQAVKPKADF